MVDPKQKQTQARYAYPKFKVFIFGVDVTEDISSINTTNHDGSAPNTCQITMFNEFDKYIITTSDMIALHKDMPGYAARTSELNIPFLRPEGMYSPVDIDINVSGLLGSESLNAGLGENVQSAFESGRSVSKKQTILSRKYPITQRLDVGDNTDGAAEILGIDFTKYYGASIDRYPLADGSPIFHPMDPVRVFMRDPFSPGRWYHFFTGFVSDMIDKVDSNNVKTLTLVVEDPTKLFRYSRVFVNPGIIDANKILEKEDFAIQTFYASPLKNMNLAEIFFTLTFGPDKVGADRILEDMNSAQAISGVNTRVDGIGHFDFESSGVFTIGDRGVNTDRLERVGGDKSETRLLDIKPEIHLLGFSTWQSLIDHEVQPSDMYTMAAEDIRAYQEDRLVAEANAIYSSDGIEGIVDYIGSHPEIYLVDGGRIMILLPASLGAKNKLIVADDIIQGAYPLNSEWQSAGSILMAVIDRIQFVMYCTPKGDIVIEPPFYDLDPSSFGRVPISPDAFVQSLPGLVVSDASARIAESINTGIASSIAYAPGSSTDVAVRGETLIRGRDRGPYGADYILLRRDTYDWESAFIDEKVHNIAVIAKPIVQQWESIPNTSIIGDLMVVKIPGLIPMYGVRQIPLTPKGYMASDDGAYIFCHIQLNKLNADAHTFRINQVPNIKLWINRPIYIQGRNCISTVKQVQHTLTWGQAGDMSTSVDLYGTRTWNGSVVKDDPKRPIWWPIGGSAGRLFDYSILFGEKEPQAIEPDPIRPVPGGPIYQFPPKVKK